MLPLSLSYDHRVIDGADGSASCAGSCEALEEPFLLHGSHRRAVTVDVAHRQSATPTAIVD